MKPDLRLKRIYEQDNPATRDRGTDKPGRTNDSLGRRSAMQIDLVLAVPPAALGEFRKAATSALTEATILELDKDRTKHPIDRIEKIVVKALDEAIRRTLGQ
jgi:protein required for attachment to host cells